MIINMPSPLNEIVLAQLYFILLQAAHSPQHLLSLRGVPHNEGLRHKRVSTTVTATANSRSCYCHVLVFLVIVGGFVEPTSAHVTQRGQVCLAGCLFGRHLHRHMSHVCIHIRTWQSM